MERVRPGFSRFFENSGVIMDQKKSRFVLSYTFRSPILKCQKLSSVSLSRKVNISPPLRTPQYRTTRRNKMLHTLRASPTYTNVSGYCGGGCEEPDVKDTSICQYSATGDLCVE